MVCYSAHLSMCVVCSITQREIARTMYCKTTRQSTFQAFVLRIDFELQSSHCVIEMDQRVLSNHLNLPRWAPLAEILRFSYCGFSYAAAAFLHLAAA
jgi:hypothetical protein